MIQLNGFVYSQVDISKAVSLAREVKGVTGGKNDMRLKQAIDHEPLPDILPAETFNRDRHLQ